MNKYLLYCLLLLGCVACNNRSEVPSSLTHLLPSEFFNIDTRIDTVLKTTKGASIYIKAGAISTKNGHMVKLEVKEAYTIADIVKAGLYTQSNGQPLSSGGMIYIVPVNQPDAAVVKPIGVKLPTAFITKGMQLFKGEYMKDSTVNWTDPQNLAGNKQIAAMDTGMFLFQRSCAPCHDITRWLTAPPLLHTTARHTTKWLEAYIYDNEAVVASGDCYANMLMNMGHNGMPAYPGLKGEPIRQIIAYLDRQSRQIDPAGYQQTRREADSCAAFLNAMQGLQHKKDSLIVDNGASLTIHHQDVGAANTNIANDIAAVDTSAQPALSPESLSYNSYYNFEINTFGWFNVDILLKENPEYVNSLLSVHISGTVSDKMKVFMIIPQDKIYLFGYLQEGGRNEYYFLDPNGQIPLPQKRKAYIIASDESKEGVFFGTAVFETSQRQQLTIKPVLSDKKAFNDFTRQFEGTGFSLKVKDTKNAKDIQEVDDLIQAAVKLKPAGIDCGCSGDGRPAPAPDK